MLAANLKFHIHGFYESSIHFTHIQVRSNLCHICMHTIYLKLLQMCHNENCSCCTGYENFLL